MLALKVVSVMLLVLCIQHVERSRAKEVVVSEEESITHLSNLDFESLCCTSGQCTCQSFLRALINLTDNVTINITTDVKLSSIVFVVGVNNARVVGYNNPTVYCNNTGGAKFVSCRNITIEGIRWEGCGFYNTTNSDPVLGMYNSSGITIQSCTFQNSIGQAVVLLNVLGNVIVNSCVFINNKQFRGHGTAVYYSGDTQVLFMIDNCSFIDNGRAQSVVYIKGYRSSDAISLLNSMFVRNHGVAVYIFYQVVYIRGNLLFESNDNGGIFSTNNSYVLFAKNSHARFCNNKADLGGAIYSNNNSNILFEENSTVTFTENNAKKYGGAIHSGENSDTSFEGNSTVIFIKNSAIFNGGAIYSHDNSNILFAENATVTFSENSARYGGAMHSLSNSKISFKDSSTATFTENNSKWDGGAINVRDNSKISFDGNSMVEPYTPMTTPTSYLTPNLRYPLPRITPHGKVELYIPLTVPISHLKRCLQ
ncbi:probable outer membrane protein pmp6 [Dysidea avara]|uniref:probable outer membrane protein pmp6 n=1 Tax=Dysidea avara TaxID=196820 RepID=UPI003320E6AB